MSAPPNPRDSAGCRSSSSGGGGALRFKNINGCIIPIDHETDEPLLLQTWWPDDPWRVCVTSLLLVATKRSQVEPILRNFYEAFPTPSMLIHSPADLHGAVMMMGLGLHNQRFMRLMRFTGDYLEDKPIRECHGVGPYVEAAYRLVHLKDRMTPTDDAVLLAYRDWLDTLPREP